MKKTLLTISILSTTLCASAYRKTTPFDNDWRFYLGNDSTAVDATYDDSKWRSITLPHDWSIEGSVDKDNPSGNDGGYYPCGIGWYRKTFNITELPKPGIRLKLYFEGVYMDSRIYLNGKYVGGHPYGYSPFHVDITDAVVKGRNVISVSVDNSKQKNSRWYSGSGIYRHVQLIESDKDGINDPQKLFVTTDKIYGISADGTRADSAVVHIQYGDIPAIKESPRYVIDEYRTFKDITLWSPENPKLYNITVGDLTIEHGFRTIEYTVDKGFLLNGKPYLINGGCLHHDNGILGAAAFNKAEWRKAELMKQGGFNAVRTAHNAPSEEFIRACDHLGLMVIDEAFDGWRSKKTPHDYHVYLDEWWQKDVDAMVLRDRNHPSVIAWSNGNEIFERRKIECITTSRKMAGRMRQLDPTRPVTNALCGWDKDWEVFDPLAETLDITGYNYLIDKCAADHERVPSRIMWQTESYIRDAFSNWNYVKDNSYIVGDFVWTAVDYLGESSIGGWRYDGENREEHYRGEHFPWHGAYCGDIDITGLRKPVSYYRDMLWNPDRAPKLFLAVREPQGYTNGEITETLWSIWPTWQSWNWPGHEGKDIEVEIYSRYPKVRLYANDKLIGEKSTSHKEEYKALFTLPYQPGTLRAVGVDNDGTEATSTMQSLTTAGAPASIRLTPTTSSLSADGQDLSFVIIEILDKDGNICPTADNLLTVSISGAATLQALGNADMKDCDTYADNKHRLWKGRAMAVVRSTQKKGKARLTVTSNGIKAATLNITCI